MPVVFAPPRRRPLALLRSQPRPPLRDLCRPYYECFRPPWCHARARALRLMKLCPVPPMNYDPVVAERQRVMRISLVEDDQASAVVKRIYDALQLRSGSVAPYFRVLAHKPDVLRAFSQLHAAIMADGALSAKLKDLAYLRASILDGCGF